MSVVALVIAPSIAMDSDEVTAHNMQSLTVTEQVVVSESAEGTAIVEETTIEVKSTELEEAAVAPHVATLEENKE
jgi:hypothetical protein